MFHSRGGGIKGRVTDGDGGNCFPQIQSRLTKFPQIPSRLTKAASQGFLATLVLHGLQRGRVLQFYSWVLCIGVAHKYDIIDKLGPNLLHWASVWTFVFGNYWIMFGEDIQSVLKRKVLAGSRAFKTLQTCPSKSATAPSPIHSDLFQICPTLEIKKWTSKGR